MTEPGLVERAPVLLSLTASEAAASDAQELIVRVLCEDDLVCLSGLPPERVAWVEVPLSLAHRSELDPFSVDVQLTDPRAEAGQLYRLASHRDPALPRLTIPSAPGVFDAVVIGMGLHFPIRVVPVQPADEQIVELEEAFQRYLHDARASQPVEPFHSALAVLLHGEAPSLWDVVEHNPADFRREPPRSGLKQPDAVTQSRDRLVADGAECAQCSLLPWCGGWFKWPDPSYDCAGVRRLFGTVEAAAHELKADLNEALKVNP